MHSNSIVEGGFWPLTDTQSESVTGGFDVDQIFVTAPSFSGGSIGGFGSIFDFGPIIPVFDAAAFIANFTADISGFLATANWEEIVNNGDVDGDGVANSQDSDPNDPTVTTDIVVTGRPENNLDFDFDLNLPTLDFSSLLGLVNIDLSSLSTIPMDSRDCAAIAAVQSIKEQTNSASQEYGYFLIKDGAGVVTRGPLLTSGSAGRIDFGGDGLQLAETGANSWSQVIGFVHNHPFEVDNPLVFGDINVINRKPSASDLDLLNQLDRLNGANDFNLYVIGPDGKTRVYDSDDDPRRVSQKILPVGC